MRILTTLCLFFMLCCFKGYKLHAQDTIILEENGADTTDYMLLPDVELLEEGRVQSSGIYPPAIIQASDGTYDNCVKVIWQALPKGFYYKVYRSDDVSFEDYIVLNGWRKSNWMIDYNDIIPGVLYYYRVEVARNTQEISAPSAINSGYAKISTDMKPVVGMTSFFAANIDHINSEILSPDDTISLSYSIQNTTEEVLENQEIVITLTPEKASDAPQHTIITTIVLPTIVSDETYEEIATFNIPSNTSPGIYRIAIQDDLLMNSLAHHLITIK